MTARHRQPATRRRFLLERLEDRTTPAAINGLVWKDSLGGGTLNGGETTFDNVLISLVQDGGNGTYDNGGGDDIPLSAISTANGGTYTFDNLNNGRYFVLVDTTAGPVTGLALAVGANPQTVNITGPDANNVNFGFRRQNPPPVVVPTGTDSTGNPFQPPGTFPVRASGAIINVAPIAGSTLGGGGSDNLLVSFPASGPVNWTESRHNEGDISASVGPNQPGNPAYYPPAMNLNYAPPDGPGTYGWRINKEVGLSFATVRTNGIDNQDVLSDGITPVGTMYGVAYFNTDASSGLGYNMVDGTFRNGGNSQDLQMGLAGSPDEGSFNVATAFFPFSEGWVGGYVSNAGAAAGAAFDQALASPGLTPAVATWLGDFTVGRANVNLTSFRADFNPTNGMLFVTPTSGNNNANIAASIPNGNGWDIAVREDNDLDTTGNTFAARTDSQFMFMYVDFRYAGLVGGRINGTNGGNLQGTNNYTMTRLSTGTYALTIPGKTGTSGSLILSGSGAQAGAATLPSRSYLSYQFDSGSGRFIIQSRQLTNGNNVFNQDSALVDSDFNFAFVDFANPVQPATAPTVAMTQVNGGAAQRSRVTQLMVTFDQQVTFAGQPAAAFTLARTGGGPVMFTATPSVVGGVTQVLINGFTGTEAENGSLRDGRYTLTAIASQITAGGAQLNGGTNYTFGDAQGLFRFYGDINADRRVDIADFGFFSLAYLTPANFNPALDFNADGRIDIADFGQFSIRYFSNLP